jgi:hypothetical protein
MVTVVGVTNPESEDVVAFSCTIERPPAGAGAAALGVTDLVSVTPTCG